MSDFRAAWRPLFSNFGPNSAGFGGGEEMLRLRAYEKLQNLVRAGILKKNGKEYRGDAAALRGFLETAAELNAKFAAGVDARKPVVPVEPPENRLFAEKGHCLEGVGPFALIDGRLVHFPF